MRNLLENLSFYVLGAIVVLSVFMFGQGVLAAVNITSKVTVGQAVPSISSVTINNSATITLTANATTAVVVNATISDNNGCADITNGTATIMIYRDAITSSTCISSANQANCYVATAFNATSSCISSTQVNTTTTFGVYYFAQATDASSSFSGKKWTATVDVTTQGNTTGTADAATAVTLNTLTAINVTTSSINFGSIQANTNTGATNQVTTSTNAGNSSTTLQLSASSALVSGSNVIATSSQVYSTSTFTYPGTSTQITASPVTVSSFFLTAPTTTTNVAQPVFWGLNVPAGTPTGTYSGTTVFGALFQT